MVVLVQQPYQEAVAPYRAFFRRFGNDKHLRLTGLHLHIGSPVYDTKPYVDNSPHLSAEDKEKIFEKNARRVYPRLSQYLK